MLKIATYNIQFSVNSQQIINTLKMLAKDGVSVFCLQEVVPNFQDNIVDKILDGLGSNWQAIYHLGDDQGFLNMGNCIIWNKRKLKLTKSNKVTLPYSGNLLLHEKIFSLLAGGITKPFKRRVITGYFTYRKKSIRITNIHLDHNGGLKNRKKQLQFLIEKLNSDEAFFYDIICGDFNNLNLWKNDREILAHQEILTGYVEATSNILWTADLNYIDTSSGVKSLQRLIVLFDIHLKRKLDYVWTSNIRNISSETILANGSDHLPVVVQLEI